MATVVAIAGAISALFGIYKLTVWLIRKSPEQKAQDIAKDISKEQQGFKDTGRPE